LTHTVVKTLARLTGAVVCLPTGHKMVSRRILTTECRAVSTATQQ